MRDCGIISYTRPQRTDLPAQEQDLTAETLRIHPDEPEPALIDYVVDRYLPLIDKLGAKIDRIEADVVEHAGMADGRDMMSEIFALKRSVQSLSRITNHQREILFRRGAGTLGEIVRIGPQR